MKSCPTCKRTYPDDTLAFCLEDGSVLSAPYDSEQTLRIPAPRVTDPPPTQMAPRASHEAQSTIHAPAPNFPPVHQSNQQTTGDDSSKSSLVPWILISGAILIVGIFGVWMVVSRMGAREPSPRPQPSPEARSTVTPESKIMCGQTVSTAIFRKWNELGEEAGKLGCPINQQTDAPPSPLGSTGRWIQFSKGDGGYLVEYTRPEALGSPKPPLFGQVFEVSGCMFKIYSSLGGTKSWLGFPTGDGRETTTGARQDFEDGYIVWDKQTYQCQAHKTD
jgi:hypothetical protein